jgi:predicted permease
MVNLLQDIRLAVRQLWNSPGFTLTTVLTLALGIGATTAIYTLVHEVILRTLPVVRPRELYKIGKETDCCVERGLQKDWSIFSYSLYKHLRDNTPGFASLAASQAGSITVSIRRGGDLQHSPSASRARFVSGNYFSTFGIDALRGRVIAPSDDDKGAIPVAVISYRLWQNSFALDPTVIGDTILLNGKAATVIGVTPPDFYGETLQPDPPQIWLPLALEPVFGEHSIMEQPDLYWLQLIGRVRPGATASSIEPELNVELQQWLHGQTGKLRPEELAEIGRQKTELVRAASGVNIVREEYDKGLKLLMTVAGFVLLIACANLANMMLVRRLGRRQEVCVRMALGAPRRRIVRQVLTESILLSVFGGFAGVGLAFAATKAILGLAFRGATDYVPIHATPSLPVLAFAFVISLVTGVVFGIAPALLISSSDPIDTLRGAGRATRGAGSLPQKSLVAFQAALSLVLLSGAILLTVSLRNVTHQSFGLRTENRLVVAIDPAVAGYRVEQLPDLYRQFDTRLTQIPGVKSISYQIYSPMANDNWATLVFLPGQQPPNERTSKWYYTSWDRVSPHFFETIGARIIRGRAFNEQDDQNSRFVAIVNESFVRRHFESRDPIGEHFAVDSKMKALFEIVGVAEDTKFVRVTKPFRPMFFLPMAQFASLPDIAGQLDQTESHYPGDIELLTQGDTTSVAMAVRQMLNEIDPNLPVLKMSTFQEQFNSNFNQQELLARLTSLFGILALLLAALGVYGATSYLVTQRTKEIGLRIALGASRANVLRIILRGALTQIVIGLAIGIPVTLLAARATASQFYGVSPFSIVGLGGSLVVLLIAASIAAVIPARRAASVDPMHALRTE